MLHPHVMVTPGVTHHTTDGSTSKSPPLAALRPIIFFPNAESTSVWSCSMLALQDQDQDQDLHGLSAFEAARRLHQQLSGFHMSKLVYQSSSHRNEQNEQEQLFCEYPSTCSCNHQIQRASLRNCSEWSSESRSMITCFSRRTTHTHGHAKASRDDTIYQTPLDAMR